MPPSNELRHVDAYVTFSHGFDCDCPNFLVVKELQKVVVVEEKLLELELELPSSKSLCVGRLEARKLDAWSL